MKAKRTDTATMTPAEREALEAREIRTQFGPLFDLYMECIDYVGHYGLEAGVPDELLDSLCLVVDARKKLGLAQRNETKALAAVRRTRD